MGHDHEGKRARSLNPRPDTYLFAPLKRREFFRQIQEVQHGLILRMATDSEAGARALNRDMVAHGLKAEDYPAAWKMPPQLDQEAILKLAEKTGRDYYFQHYRDDGSVSLEDIVQDARCATVQHPTERYEGGLVLSIRHALDRQRDERHKLEAHEVPMLTDADGELIVAMGEAIPTSGGERPERAIRRLPLELLTTMELRVIRLRYELGYSQAEVAAELGLQQFTVSRTEARAIEKLRPETKKVRVAA